MDVQSSSPFFIRRSARILPLYYVGLAVYVFVLPLVQNGALENAMVRASSWWWFYLQGVPLTLGTVEAALGRPAEAEAWLRQAVYLAPSHPEALVQLALLAEARGDHGLATRYRMRAARSTG